jgi:hypothetical protein
MRLVVLCDRPGQLGNLLIVFTHFAALALERNLQIVNPAFSPYKHYFEGTHSCQVACFNTNQALSRLRLSYAFANSMFRIVRRASFEVPHFLKAIPLDWNQSLDLDQPVNQDRFNCQINVVGGWLFRCDFLVSKYKPQLARFFLPLKEYREEAMIHIARARQNASASLLIGIHIRHGDYKEFQGGRFYYPLSFYRSLIQSLRDQHPATLAFVVVSDQPLSYEYFDDPNVYLSNSSELVDMIILSLCDGVIGPPSTFSHYSSCIWGNSNLHHLEHDEIQIPQAFFDSMSLNTSSS